VPALLPRHSVEVFLKPFARPFDHRAILGIAKGTVAVSEGVYYLLVRRLSLGLPRARAHCFEAKVT
jgi:hypothetical protein